MCGVCKSVNGTVQYIRGTSVSCYQSLDVHYRSISTIPMILHTMARWSLNNVVRLCLFGLFASRASSQSPAARNLATIQAVYNSTVRGS